MDLFGLIYTKVLCDKNALLKNYPELSELEIQLQNDFEDHSAEVARFMVFHNKNLHVKLKDILGLIKEHNSKVIMPNFDSFLSEKNVVLA